MDSRITSSRCIAHSVSEIPLLFDIEKFQFHVLMNTQSVLKEYWRATHNSGSNSEMYVLSLPLTTHSLIEMWIIDILYIFFTGCGFCQFALCCSSNRCPLIIRQPSFVYINRTVLCMEQNERRKERGLNGNGTKSLSSLEFTDIVAFHLHDQSSAHVEHFHFHQLCDTCMHTLP